VEQLLIIAGIIVGGTGAAAATGCALTVRRLRRANRVVPDTPTPAPMTWLWSWQEPARLHRRLRRAVDAAVSAVLTVNPDAARSRRRRHESDSPLATLAHEVADQAALIDRQLASVSNVPRQWRGREMSVLSEKVRELEASAYRMGQLAMEWRAQLRQSAVSEPAPALELRAKLDALEAAMTEVNQLGVGR
jgi:hypothetical protein